jgi:regulator of sigma E protease
VSAGVGELSATASATLGGLGSLIAGADDYSRAVVDGERHADAPAGFMSPVGAADLLGRLSDPQLILRFAAIISVSLGVFNLLPFPPLDGGHLAVEAVNAIRSRLAGRRVNVSVRAQNVAATATLAFFALMTLAALRLDVAAGV